MKKPRAPDFVSAPAVGVEGVAYVYCARVATRGKRKILWSRMPALQRLADAPCTSVVVPKPIRDQAYAWFAPYGVHPARKRPARAPAPALGCGQEH